MIRRNIPSTKEERFVMPQRARIVLSRHILAGKDGDYPGGGACFGDINHSDQRMCVRRRDRPSVQRTRRKRQVIGIPRLSGHMKPGTLMWGRSSDHPGHRVWHLTGRFQFPSRKGMHQTGR